MPWDKSARSHRRQNDGSDQRVEDYRGCYSPRRRSVEGDWCGNVCLRPYLSGLLFAWPVCATIAKGSIKSLDTAEAEKMTGVVAVYHRANIGPLYRVPPATG